MFSIAHGRSSVALGMIIGSTISNVLGAFSLGLLCYKGRDGEIFDDSSKVYSLLLLAPTTFTAGILVFGRPGKSRWAGWVAIAIFVAYIACVSWAIWNGRLSAPEDSDSDSDSSDNETDQCDDATRPLLSSHGDVSSIDARREQMESTANHAIIESTAFEGDSESALLHEAGGSDHSHDPALRKKHSVSYHVAQLILGMLAILLSSYVLSHAAGALANELHVPDVAFGAVILAIATTIPEKFVAIVSGYRGHMGIMVANTVGSNVFLLTLCMGILWLDTGGSYDSGSIHVIEVGIMLGSSLVMALAVRTPRRWARMVGAAMLAAYIAFLVLEFTVIHPV